MKVKYIGPARDYSGYGEAVRHDIGALCAAKVDLTVKIPMYVLELSDFGPLGELCMSHEGKDIDYDTVIIHTTPNTYPQYVERDKYNIGRAFWETDKIPSDFAYGLNLVDEIWTGSEYNAAAIRKAGVTKPIYIIPEAIDTSLDIDKVEPYTIVNKDTFKFYSLFEWTERKNPTALLTAYWKEFENTENVSLTLKTYVDNFTPEKRKEIDFAMKVIKNSLNLKRYAPVYVFKGLMDRHQIYRFHKSFNCFVSAHRGEGWGIPQMEALLMGNPIISTNAGGIHEYLHHGEDALLIDYKLQTLTANSRNNQWYSSDQQWAEVDIIELQKAMGAVYQNQKQAREIGTKGRATVLKEFSFEAVGKKMLERLEKIPVKLKSEV